MSTSDTPPIDPTSGGPGEPQDPTNPTNPYGTPPPPPDPTMPVEPTPPAPPAPPAAPPAAPAYGQPPVYGQPPAAPAYGQPPAAPAYGQPAYGQQPPAYGQPAPQVGYGQPFPGGPGFDQGEPGKGMAVGALITGIFGFVCGIPAIVSIILAIIVLRRSKDGRKHGRGLAITGMVIAILWLLALIIGIVAAVVVGSKYSSVDDLNPGTCITAKGLSSSDDSLSQIKKVSCSTSHDGEVLATHTLTSAEAKSYGNDEANQLCEDAITKANKTAVITGGVNFVGLTETSDPSSGDTLACVAFNSDGSKLKSKLGG